MNLSIRLASHTDASLIADLSRKTFSETFAAQNMAENMEKFMREQFSTEKLMEEVKDQANLFFLAFDNEQPAGYAKIREGENKEVFNNRPAIEIARIYALRSAIGTGVGKALMQQCIDTALERKTEIIWLGVWEHNLRAIGFYTRWGFEKFGTQLFQLGDDPQTDWLMKKELALL